MSSVFEPWATLTGTCCVSVLLAVFPIVTAATVSPQVVGHHPLEFNVRRHSLGRCCRAWSLSLQLSSRTSLRWRPLCCERECVAGDYSICMPTFITFVCRWFGSILDTGTLFPRNFAKVYGRLSVLVVIIANLRLHSHPLTPQDHKDLALNNPVGFRNCFS